ncbi:DUF551 domain-containing protein [Escherichia coli]
MTTITKERIELFIKNPLDNGLTRGEQMELARIALASLGAEPVSQTYKLPPLSSSEVNDAAWKLHNMLTEHVPLNGRQFNNLKGCFYEALKVAMRNYPVTPDGWISCSEQMPSAGEQVLAYRPDAPESNDPLIKMATYVGGSVHGHGFDCYCKPTHWMPLPAAPQLEVNRG